jgi:hypothetical protein
MPGTLVPAQNFDHLLDPVSGYDGMHDLQFHAPPEDGADFRRGALVSLNAAGNIVAGCGAADMPLWSINDTGDFDVASDVGNFSGGIIATFVATGGYELKTTEFVDTDVYAPNDLLTAGTAGDVGLVGLSPALYGDAVIVGCVSKGQFEEVYGQHVLQFWPMFIPTIAGAFTP